MNQYYSAPWPKFSESQFSKCSLGSEANMPKSTLKNKLPSKIKTITDMKHDDSQKKFTNNKNKTLCSYNEVKEDKTSPMGKLTVFASECEANHIWFNQKQ